MTDRLRPEFGEPLVDAFAFIGALDIECGLRLCIIEGLQINNPERQYGYLVGVIAHGK